MRVVTPKVNAVILNRGADLFFMGENVAVPFGQRAAKDVPNALAEHGADQVVFEYRTTTDPDDRKRDAAKYTRRLSGLGGIYTVGPWRNRVVDGHTFPDVFECVASRVAEA